MVVVSTSSKNNELWGGVAMKPYLGKILFQKDLVQILTFPPIKLHHYYQGRILGKHHNISMTDTLHLCMPTRMY